MEYKGMRVRGMWNQLNGNSQYYSCNRIPFYLYNIKYACMYKVYLDAGVDSF